MSGWIKGPWDVREAWSSDDDFEVYPTYDGERPELGEWAELAVVKGGHIEQAEANARLIAAAPDLYAALTQAIGPLEYAYRNVSSVTADKVKQKILPAMRAALARARGETP